ncbi:helix-turn-helix domain-containing protein [Rhodococcus sp. NPDC006774]|jgi:AcrR family transcriptional regulator|uniref:TetR/AcrR family transcriptional regulator n=1 Tax=Rhodococcus sp. NPDC006774 TaxID=3157186 RepID=UPI0033DB9D75
MPPRNDAATRPVTARGRARREQITAVAAELFHQRGYEDVTLAEVARRVDLTAPALYRHFSSKEQLLMAAVVSTLGPAESVLRQYADRDVSHLVAPMIDVALERREIWTLVQREVRHLDADDRRVIEGRYAMIVHTVTASVSASYADLSPENCHLIACAMLSVAGSPSTDPVDMDLSRYREALENIEFALLSFDLRRTPARRDGVGALGDGARPGSDEGRTGSRVTAVEDAAVGLFYRVGYAAVTVDDIGAAAGITGPSVYHYVSSKSELLVDVLFRAVTMVADGARTALAQAGTPDEKLRVLVRSYCAVAAANRELFGVYITEAGNVPLGDARRLRESMARDVDRWVEAVMRSRPGLDVNDARVRVFAARRVVTDMVRLERTDEDRLAHVTELLALTVLQES